MPDSIMMGQVWAAIKPRIQDGAQVTVRSIFEELAKNNPRLLYAGVLNHLMKLERLGTVVLSDRWDDGALRQFVGMAKQGDGESQPAM